MREEKLSDIIEEQISGEWGEDGDGVAVLRSTNFTNDGRLNLDNVVQRSIDKKKVEKKKLLLGDSIIEKSGGSPDQPVGRVVYFDIQEGTFLCNNFTSILRPKKEVHHRYFFWFLFYNHQIKRTLRYQNKTTGIINLQLARYLEETKIPLPSIANQKKVAEILDKADILRQKDKQLLKLYDDLAQSVFYEMFGDPFLNDKGFKTGKIKDIVSEVNYGTSKPAENNGEYPYLRMNNITYSGDWDFTSLKFINLLESEKEKYLLKKGDIVFNRTNSKELVGKTAVYYEDSEMAIAGYLIRVRTNEKSVPEYISGYLNSSHGKTKLKTMCKSIIGMANINAQELQGIDILIPPLELQLQYASTLKQIRSEKLKVNRDVDLSESLFQSLLQSAFNGELKP